MPLGDIETVSSAVQNKPPTGNFFSKNNTNAASFVVISSQPFGTKLRIMARRNAGWIACCFLVLLVVTITTMIAAMANSA